MNNRSWYNTFIRNYSLGATLPSESDLGHSWFLLLFCNFFSQQMKVFFFLTDEVITRLTDRFSVPISQRCISETAIYFFANILRLFFYPNCLNWLGFCVEMSRMFLSFLSRCRKLFVFFVGKENPEAVIEFGFASQTSWYKPVKSVN